MTATTPAGSREGTLSEGRASPGEAPAPGAAPSPRRRILIALPGLHRVRRGAEVALESIGQHLAAAGHVVTLVGSGRPDPARAYRFRSSPCLPRERLERLPSIPVLRTVYAYEELTFVPGLAVQALRDRHDVTVACSYPFTSWTLRALRLGRRSPAHVYVTQNGDWPAYARNSEYRLFSCDGLVCTNPVYYERNRERWRCALIPNGVDERVFAPGPRRTRFGLPDAAPVALMVSALIPSKRVVDGIRAVARVPGLHLLVAGDGELRAEVDACGAALLGRRFRRVAISHEEMPELYRAADVLLHMSQADPSPLAYVEALATGLPVVAHDEPVTRWTFEGVASLVDTTDGAAVAAALERALGATSAAEVAARRALVERRFTWSAVARQYAEFFEVVLRGSRGS
ncbi:glycosyltransferase family 4 protein [Anaeromyxobacter oryzae]|uniref:glycosyltransferase family 4 protein n=1 Tax=Anaeromyxobacter oryzae TaxID=2918170 RepID=UPI0020BDAA61|nr:glycosyltransferase family 4 protein [Anaeromyxobacter oryzae]